MDEYKEQYYKVVPSAKLVAYGKYDSPFNNSSVCTADSHLCSASHSHEPKFNISFIQQLLELSYLDTT